VILSNRASLDGDQKGHFWIRRITDSFQPPTISDQEEILKPMTSKLRRLTEKRHFWPEILAFN
jgi:hypothetical protein